MAHKLRELEEDSKRLNKLLDKALLSDSSKEKEDILNEFDSSELITYKFRLRRYIDHENPVETLIKLATQTLPSIIENLEKKAKLLEIQLNSEYTELLVKEQKPSVSRGKQNTEVVTDEPLEKTSVKSQLLLKKLQAALEPYMATSDSRTSEYYYGFMGTIFSQIGLAGNSKTDILNTINKLYQKIESYDAEELDDKDIAILTTGTLGDVINPLLKDEEIGKELKELLTTAEVKKSQLQ